MGRLDIYLVLTAVVVYGLATVLFLTGTIFSKERVTTWAVRAGFLGMALHTGGVILRWWISGHAPSNLYELNSLGGLLAVAYYLWNVRKRQDLKILGLVLFPLVLLLIGYGFTKFSEVEPLKPEYQSFWLTLHIIFAFTATACYVLSFCGSVIYVLRGFKIAAPYLEKAPGDRILNDLNARLNALGFANHALMILTGAIWAQQAWGSYWSWDPIETWSLITWLVYGLYLHLFFTLNWRGKRIQILNLLAFAIIVISYWLVPHLPVRNFL